MNDLFKYEYNPEAGAVKITFSGRMDTNAADQIGNYLQSAEEILNLPEKGPKLQFDLSGVDYIASSFIRLCVGYAKQAGAGNFSIVNCQPFVKKTFKISGLDSFLNII